MAVQQFRQMEGPDFRTALTGISQAGNTFDKAFNTGQKFISQRQDAANFEIDKETEANTRSFRSELEGMQDLGALNQADQSGQFGIDAMTKRFGTRFDEDDAAKQVTAARDRLRNSAVSAASGVGRATAQDEGDMTAGSERVFQSLIDQGANPDFAQEEANKWVQNAKSLKQEINKDKTDRTIEAIKGADVPTSNADIEQTVNNSVGVDRDALRDSLRRTLSGSKEDKAAARTEKNLVDQEAITKGLADALSGASIDVLANGMTDSQKVEFISKARTQQDQLGSLTNEQNLMYKRKSKELEDIGTLMSEQNSVKIQTLQAELQAIPNDTMLNTQKNFGVNGMNDMQSVIDVIGDEQNWTVDEQPEKLRTLQKYIQETYPRDDAVALIAQAWTDTKAASASWHGQSIDIEMMKKHVEANLANRKLRKEKQAQINAATHKENLRKFQYNSNMATTLSNLQGAMMGRNTNRTIAPQSPVSLPSPVPTQPAQTATQIVNQIGSTLTPAPPEEVEVAKKQLQSLIKEENASKNVKQTRTVKQASASRRRAFSNFVNKYGGQLADELKGNPFGKLGGN